MSRIALVALSALVGCETALVCTEIGCSASLEIAVDGELPADAIVTLAIDGAAPETCTFAEEPEPFGPCTFGVDSVVRGLDDPSGGDDVASAIVTVTLPGGAAATHEVELVAGEPQHPNGEDCPPECVSASGSLTL